jgi:hypothetical protein
MREQRATEIAGELWDRVRLGLSQVTSGRLGSPAPESLAGIAGDTGLKHAFESAWRDCDRSGATLALVLFAIDRADELEAIAWQPKNRSALVVRNDRPDGDGRSLRRDYRGTHGQRAGCVLLLPALPEPDGRGAAKGSGARGGRRSLSIPQPMPARQAW